MFISSPFFFWGETSPSHLLKGNSSFTTIYAIFIFIAISSRSRSSWSLYLLKKCLAIEECATGFCLARGVVTALNGHLLEPSSSMVSFLKLFEPERNCDFPATQGTRRQILQIMHFFFSKKTTSHGNSSFHLGWNFLFRATFGADVSGFFGPYYGPPVQPYPWYFFELVYWVMYDEW